MFGHPAVLAWGSLFVFVGTAAALVEPRLFGYTIDEAIVPKDGNRLAQLTALFLFIIVARVAAMIGQGYLFEALGQAVTQDLRMAVFSRLQKLPLSFFDRNPAGRLLTRVTNDIAALAEIFSAGFVMMVSNALLVAGILIWLIVLSPRLGLITVSVFPVMAILTVRFSRQLAISYREARSKLSALNAYLAENLMGMRVVHLFNRQNLHLQRFSRLNQRYTDAQVSTIRTYAFLQPTITIASGASMALLIWFGGNEALDGRVQLGVLVAYFAYALALFRPLREIADKWNIFLSGLASAERIFAVLDWPTELPDVTSEAPYEGLKGHIVFENVWFAYDDEHWVLRNISFEIPAGTRLGIVGHTGSGKTTLINLLMRFYEPQKGRILLDGKDLREYDKSRLRASLGLVQQDVFLFSGSVSENISLFAAKSERSPSAILEQLGLANERLLSERGGNLSAGERQFVAFARASEKRPRIWILDEPTSNIDSASELRLEQALMTESQGKTVIVIAHRLATTRSCGQVLVLNKGQLVEMGDHSSLMRGNGLYARLFRYQQAASSVGTVDDGASFPEPGKTARS
jgi:ATP-binding cassette subfamily B protein